MPILFPIEKSHTERLLAAKKNAFAN